MKDEIKIQLQPVQTKRASEEIYEQIRQLILDGKNIAGRAAVFRTEHDGDDAPQPSDHPGSHAHAGTGWIY